MLSQKERLIASLIFGFMCLFLGLDIADDLRHGSTLEHIVEELAIAGAALFGFLYLWLSNVNLKQQNASIKVNLKDVENTLKQYKKDTAHLAEGLSKQIDAQLEMWHLSKSEKDVALLLLKGLSIKEIAEVRKTAEKTVSQQTSSIYEKSKLLNRSELAAFFLEDLFSPR